MSKLQVDKSHEVPLEAGPSLSCSVDPLRLHRKSSEESVGSVGSFVRASSGGGGHQSCPNTALRLRRRLANVLADAAAQDVPPC